MDTTFAATLAHWSNFYLALAAGAATFSGLLFVALSLHADLIAREDKRLLRTAAKLTFNLFLTVFFVALLLLLPDQSPASASWTLAGLGALGLAVPLVEVGTRLRRHAGLARLGPLRVPLGLPVLLDLVLIRQGFAVGAGDGEGLALLPLLLAFMLATAALLSWTLLIELAQYKTRLAAQGAEDGRDRGLERQLRAVARELRAQNRRQREAAPPADARPPRESERVGRR